MVRVAGLQHAVADGDESPDMAGLTPSQQLAAVAARAHAMVDIALSAHDGRPHAGAGKSGRENRRVEGPRAHPPGGAGRILSRAGAAGADAAGDRHVASVSAALVAQPQPRAAARRRAGRDRAPPRDRSGAAGPDAARARSPSPAAFNFVLLEEIISAHLPSLFPGQPILESAVIRLSRDAELEFDDEGGHTQLELVERELRRRRRSGVVRLEISADASEEAGRAAPRSARHHGRRRLRRPGTARFARPDGADGSAGARWPARSAAAAG